MVQYHPELSLSDILGLHKSILFTCLALFCFYLFFCLKRLGLIFFRQFLFSLLWSLFSVLSWRRKEIFLSLYGPFFALLTQFQSEKGPFQPDCWTFWHYFICWPTSVWDFLYFRFLWSIFNHLDIAIWASLSHKTTETNKCFGFFCSIFIDHFCNFPKIGHFLQQQKNFLSISTLAKTTKSSKMRNFLRGHSTSPRSVIFGPFNLKFWYFVTFLLLHFWAHWHLFIVSPKKKPRHICPFSVRLIYFCCIR